MLFYLYDDKYVGIYFARVVTCATTSRVTYLEKLNRIPDKIVNVICILTQMFEYRYKV